MAGETDGFGAGGALWRRLGSARAVDAAEDAGWEQDRADLAAILEHALAERARSGGALTDALGLEPEALCGLLRLYFPNAVLAGADAPRTAPTADQTAIATLLRWRGGASRAQSAWFADIVARRSMETRHLWEDLGLPSRPALTALMERHFPRMRALNSANMRWKKFFYRQICADAAFSLCLSPTCDDCEERAECFAPDEAAAL